MIYSLLVICAECPVRRACLEYALSTNIDCVGVWGTSTAWERRRLLPIHNSAKWRYGDTRRRVVEQALETLETNLPTRLRSWRGRARQQNEAQVENGTNAPRYPVGRAPAIA